MGDDDDLDEAASDIAVSEDFDDDDLPDDIGNGDIADSGGAGGAGGGAPVQDTDDDGPFDGVALTDADFETLEVIDV